MARKKRQPAELINHIAREDKSVLEEYVLDKTDLDEKAMKALDDVEVFLREKHNNLNFVWSNFRYASCMLIAGGGLVGLFIGYLL